MEPLYQILENKFAEILSGTCLTSFREENTKIAGKYECFDESKLQKMREDFCSYVSNYLFLKGYGSISRSESGDFVTATNDSGTVSFFIDFDYGKNDGSLFMKVLDKGVKCGISSTEAKYVIVISVEKGLMVMMNCENVKTYVREKKHGFGLLTETDKSDSLFKTQYVVLDLNEVKRKARVFLLK